MKQVKWIVMPTVSTAVLSCSPLIHGDTLVNGFITDEAGLPVDSIRVVLDGAFNFATEAVIGEAK